MDSIFKQDARLGRLVTDLGVDTLVLLRFTGTDEMNDLFRYQVEALSTEPDLDFDLLIGTHASVELQTRRHDGRWFDGIVTQVNWLGTGETGNRYNLTLQPWTFVASKRRNQKIFHNKTVVQIIEEVFHSYAGLGSPVFEDKLTKSYLELEYTVQYRESDLDFVARLMQRFGISYFFRHEEGSHTLVLCDSVEDNPHIPGDSREFIGLTGHHHSDEEHFWHWAPERNLTTGAIRLTDFNFKKPTSAMEVERAGDAKYAQGQVESFDYPGDYLVEGDGKNVSELRVNQERSGDRKHHAVGDLISLGSGMKVKLAGEKLPGVEATEYLCLSATHTYVSDSYGSGSDGEETLAFSGKYQLVPVSTPMVPQRKTAAPMVHGPQTAMVVGDGEIDCDDHGRILVHFHWDLDKAFSMRCRVSQNWAGNGWGGMVIPRIGMEVLVEFLEGDPDKPMVTGCVYNGKNKPPYELPANKTRSTFKTDSHQADGFNEVRFEDKAGEEEIFLHAQKDRNEKIENNQTQRVNINKVESVGHNKASEVGNNLSQIVDGDMNINVGPANKGSYTPSGADGQTQGIGPVAEMLGRPGAAKRGIGDLKISVEAAKTQAIGRDHFEKVDRDKESPVGKNYTATAGKKIKIEAGDEIKLICGQSRIKLSANGTIEINGQKILQLGDRLVTVKSDVIKLN